MVMNPHLRIVEVDRMQATNVLLIAKALLGRYSALNGGFLVLHTVGLTRSIRARLGILVLNQKVGQDMF